MGYAFGGFHETCVLGHRHIALYMSFFWGGQGLMHGLWGLCIIVYAQDASALQEHCMVCDFLYG